MVVIVSRVPTSRILRILNLKFRIKTLTSEIVTSSVIAKHASILFYFDIKWPTRYVILMRITKAIKNYFQKYNYD